ncbi:MAG: hypothetical protein QHC40_12365 [Sphingobium sp.]|nr:hypothetical protein [Sphingobium sp.]
MSAARFTLPSFLLLSLAACATVPPPQPAARANPGPPASAFMKVGPLLGNDAKQLTRQFGAPRLDIREDTMRKLQFANGRCVLDAYLYAPAPGKEPVVTHVDARSPIGADIDPASCAAALQQPR